MQNALGMRDPVLPVQAGARREAVTSAGSVYLTGHSMGGALATLCAYELAVRFALTPLSSCLAAGAIARSQSWHSLLALLPWNAPGPELSCVLRGAEAL